MKHLIIWVTILLALVCKLSVGQNIYIGHIPGSTSDISVFGSGSLFFSGDITIDSGGVYANNGTVEVKGDIVNANDALAFGTGTLTLTGSVTQNITGTPLKVYNITINNTSTTGVVLSTDLTVANTATFIDGLVSNSDNAFTFNAGSSSIGASNASRVTGVVSKLGNTGFMFPVGDQEMLRTAAISAPNSVTDKFSVQYIRSTPTSGTLGTGLNRISSLEYWDINRVAGTSEPKITLSYDASYSVTDVVADLRVVSLVDGVWTDMGGTGASNLVAASTPSSGFGAFTLGSSTYLNPLPVELISFKAFYNNVKSVVDLTWATASEINSDYFTVERSSNGKNWMDAVRIAAAGNSSSINNYYYVDFTPFSNTVYYRLKQTDFNGEFEYSNIQVVTKLDKLQDLQVLPNPITSNTTLKLWSENNDAFNLEILNNVGQVVLQRILPVTQGDNTIFIEMDQLPAGNYHIKMQSQKSYKLITKQIIKIN